jgi:hypothetical protein
MTDARTLLEKVLTDHGILPNENGFHAWRCEHPDRYPGYCHCVPDLLDALEPHLAAAAEAATLRERVAALEAVAREWHAEWHDRMAMLEECDHARCRRAAAALAPTPATDEARCWCLCHEDGFSCPYGQKCDRCYSSPRRFRPTPTEPAP